MSGVPTVTVPRAVAVSGMMVVGRVLLVDGIEPGAFVR